MTLTPDQLIGFVNMVFWPFVRITTLLMASPLFGARTFPVRQRIILGMLVAILISPLLPAVPAIQAFSVEGMLITAQQVVIGVAMGFILQMVFGALVVGGLLVRLVAMGRRERRGTFESTRRRRRRGGDAAREGRVGRSDA